MRTPNSFHMKPESKTRLETLDRQDQHNRSQDLETIPERHVTTEGQLLAQSFPPGMHHGCRSQTEAFEAAVNLQQLFQEDQQPKPATQSATHKNSSLSREVSDATRGL